MNKRKDREELTALNRLRADHGYMLFELSRQSTKVTTIAKGLRSGKPSLTVGIGLYLVVPAESAIGRSIIEQRENKPTKKRGRR